MLFDFVVSFWRVCAVERCIAWFGAVASIKTIQARGSPLYMEIEETGSFASRSRVGIHAVWILVWDYFVGGVMCDG